MNADVLTRAMRAVGETMAAHADELTELDQKSGDGDLGVSMKSGFRAAADALDKSSDGDLGKLLMKAGTALNESAPSTLGTLLSFVLLGMAKELKGKTEATLSDVAGALASGLARMMERAGSKPGEKTVLDSLLPGIEELKAAADRGDDAKAAFSAAASAARQGAERTREMAPVHGRAAYYGDKGIGLLDGGAVAGALLFEAISGFLQDE